MSAYVLPFLFCFYPIFTLHYGLIIEIFENFYPVQIFHFLRKKFVAGRCSIKDLFLYHELNRDWIDLTLEHNERPFFNLMALHENKMKTWKYKWVLILALKRLTVLLYIYIYTLLHNTLSWLVFTWSQFFMVNLLCGAKKILQKDFKFILFFFRFQVNFVLKCWIFADAGFTNHVGYELHFYFHFAFI